MSADEISRAKMDASSRGKKKILIIDDDPTILHLLRKVFLGSGFQVAVAKDGLEAMETLTREIPALVITDLKMPCLSGAELISWIRRTKNELPIIVMTAYPYLYPEKKDDSKIEAYFRKPFDIHEMLASVERILGR